MSTTSDPAAVPAETRRQLVQDTWSAAWDRGETDALDDLLSPDYRRTSAAEDEGLNLEQFKASIVATRTAFPDLVTHVEDIVVEGDRVAVRWRSVGTHDHPFLGVPATRRQVTVSGATFAAFGADGKIHLEQVTWDPRSLLSALGIITVGQD